LLYCHYASLENAPTSLNATKKILKINDRRLSNNFKILEELGLISQSPGVSRVIIFPTRVISSPTPLGRDF
jgi:hypothetical protein